MALFKDNNFHVLSVTVHTRNTKMRKWLWYNTGKYLDLSYTCRPYYA